MITLINSAGREVDSSPYRERLQVPANKQDEIREWVSCAELAIHNSDASASDYFGKVREFLYRATYVENLLDRSFEISKGSVEVMTSFKESLLPLPEGSTQIVNDRMYDLEKMVRLGISVQLSLQDKEIIASVENDHYEEGKIPQLIKMLGRHTTFGLPEFDVERKRRLQQSIIMPQQIFQGWLGCAALRAGLTLPSCSQEVIDSRIKGYFEQEPVSLRGVLSTDYFIGHEEQERIVQDEEALLQIYVSGAHHLKRLLGEG